MKERLFRDLPEALKESPWLAVSIHWGIEGSPAPSPGQRRLARRMARLGARLIAGHHPHVIQPIEKIGDCWVAYSLGNFVFDQRDVSARSGMILWWEIHTSGSTRLAFSPVLLDEGAPRFLDEEEIPAWFKRHPFFVLQES